MVMLVRQWKEAAGEMGECQSKKKREYVGQTMEGSGW